MVIAIRRTYDKKTVCKRREKHNVNAVSGNTQNGRCDSNKNWIEELQILSRGKMVKALYGALRVGTMLWHEQRSHRIFLD